MSRLQFSRRWFFASGPAIAHVQTEWGGTLPHFVTVLHSMLAQSVLEYQWAEIAPSDAIDGWFQPKDVHAADSIAQIPGVVLLPSLLDPTPVDQPLADLLKHAKVSKGDVPYTVIKKLCDHHHTHPRYAFKHPGLRPEL